MTVPLQQRATRVAVRGLRVTGLCLATVVMTTAAFGWLYWMRIDTTGWPGPRMTDALPLDELAGHADVPTFVFVGALGLAAVIIGLVARVLRFDRLTAGFGLAIGVGVWMLLVDTLSLYAVRQSTLPAAFHAAIALQPVYVAAGLAGLCGALLGRRTLRAKWSRVLAWAVGLCGALDLVSAIIPRHHGFGRLESLAPSFVPLLSALAVPVGVVLLLSARVLARGNVWAYRLSVTLLSISTVLHLLRGLHFGAAVASGLVAVALVARRQDFRSPGNPSAPSQSFGRLAAMIAIVFAYGVTTLVINRIVADLPISLPSAALDTLRAMIGTSPRDSAYFIGRLGEWFPWSVISLMAIGVGWAAAPWLAPWRDRFTGDRARRERARQIITKFGTDTLSPFALRADKDRFFFGGPEAAGRPEGDEVLIAYRTVRGIALMSGDPIGPPDKIPAAIEAFLAYAHLRAWGVAVLGASDRYLDAYRAAGLRGLYHGDEAVIEVASFSLQGGAMKSVRQAAHRVERNGYVAEILPAGAVDPSLRQELRDVERQWLGGRPKTGFVMELEDLFALDDDDALFVIARSGDGRVVAFLHLAVCRAGKSLSLSSPPRRSDLPNGVIAWLVCKTVEYARNNGYGAISLNFSPFAGLFASGDDSIRQHLERDVLLLLKRRLSLQLDNLLLFNRKFNPVWRPRYVLFERYSELPRVIVSAMAAEGYLPFSERIRGRGWKPAEEPAGSRLEGGEVSPGQPAAGEDDEARVP